MKKRGRKTQSDKIKLISKIRARNNILWMKLLKLAVETSPRKSKTILSAINQNDQQISRWLGSL